MIFPSCVCSISTEIPTDGVPLQRQGQILTPFPPQTVEGLRSPRVDTLVLMRIVNRYRYHSSFISLIVIKYPVKGNFEENGLLLITTEKSRTRNLKQLVTEHYYS